MHLRRTSCPESAEHICKPSFDYVHVACPPVPQNNSPALQSASFWPTNIRRNVSGDHLDSLCIALFKTDQRLFLVR